MGSFTPHPFQAHYYSNNKKITIIKTITVNVEAHYTVLGNMPTVHILTAKVLRSFVFPNNLEKCYLRVSLKICGSTKIIIFLDRNS